MFTDAYSSPSVFFDLNGPDLRIDEILNPVAHTKAFVFLGEHLEIVPCPNMVPDVLQAEETQPIFPYKLPIGQAVDRLSTEPFGKSFISAIRSPVLEFPRLSSIRNIKGKATFLYEVLNIKMSILLSPSFQFVRPIIRVKEPEAAVQR